MNPQQNQQPQMIMPQGGQGGQAPQIMMPGQAPMGGMPGQMSANMMQGQMPPAPQMMQMQQPMQAPQVSMPGQVPQMGAMPANGPVPQNPNAASIGSAAMQAQSAAPVSHNRDVPTSTQTSLLISELRDNVVIMKDGSFRAVVACKSINFDLMSEAERAGVEISYQDFLNSLKFTTQILVRSQRVDIGPYLDKLSELRRNNDNMLLGVLMDDYINFVDILSQEANIMDKSFFIVIPYYTSADAEKLVQQTKNFFKAFSKSKGIDVTKIDRATYDKALSELSNRVDSVMAGLFNIGIHSVRLNTRELAELYYNFNNPDTAVREPLVDFSKLATMYVRKADKEEMNG